MDQKTKPSLSLNMQAGARTSSTGKALPHYRGTIMRPDNATPRDVVAWSGEFADKDGTVLTYWNGSVDPVSRQMSAMEQVKARAAASTALAHPAIAIGGREGQKPVMVEDGRFVMFEAKHKDGSNIATNGKRRADAYGYWNDGGELIQLGGYINNQKGRLASIVGKTQFPMSKEQLETTGGEMNQADIDAMNELAESGYEAEVTGFDNKPAKRSRGGR